MKLLDLFCGAGGCTKGYQMAGFTVRGVDIKRQPRYCGEEFVQAEALEYLTRLIESGEIEKFDLIHASPPCQAYSINSGMHKKKGKIYPDLYLPTRRILIESGKPYVIENVMGAPASHAIVLCGNSFGLRVYRHRCFESNFLLLAPPHQAHRVKCAPQGRPAREDQFMVVTGNYSGVKQARLAMGIEWMSRDELSQAIPPVYAECVGRQLFYQIERLKRAAA